MNADPTTLRQAKYSKEFIAPICEKVDEFLKSQNVGKEDFALVMIQMCGSLFEPHSIMSQMLFQAWCLNEQTYYDKKVRESN